MDAQGIHAIVMSGSKLSYVVYNICSGRVEVDNPFPSEASFMGLYPNYINLTCAAEVNVVFINVIFHCPIRIRHDYILLFEALFK